MSRTLKRIVCGVVAVACVITPAAALGAAKQDKVRARMTGGGHVLGTSLGKTVKITHGFELHCRTATRPQRLQINWSGGNSFHLTQLEDSFCLEFEDIDQENPEAPIDTYVGEGFGNLTVNGKRSVGYAEWTFVDGGEPGGGADTIELVIKDAAGNVVLTADDALTKGNHQAHRGTGS